MNNATPADRLFEPEATHRIDEYHYMVVAAPAAQPLWMTMVERGSWQGALLVALFGLFQPKVPITVRAVRFRRKVSLRWSTVSAFEAPSVGEANRIAREWDRQLARGVVPTESRFSVGASTPDVPTPDSTQTR